MLSPPTDLPEATLRSTVVEAWGVAVTSMAYRPVGFGSHHWEVVDADGTRWFVTIDDLAESHHSTSGPPDMAYHRLHASLSTARQLRDWGHEFVVAPVPTTSGDVLARLGTRFAVALYPFVAGESFHWGPFTTAAHRRGALEMVTAVHTAPERARRDALADDFAIPHRADLVAALDTAGEVEPCGPYARPAATLVAGHAGRIARLLGRYDALAADARVQPDRAVLTHGEPHAGNTMRTGAGWRLIDWDTALVAPPERDLWIVADGDASVLETYADATGVTPQPAMLELYRLRWDLTDIAVEVRRFRRPHAGSVDDDEAWRILRRLVESVSR